MKSTRRKTKKTITKNMILGEVTRLYPNSIEIMLEHGLHCGGCFASAFDTIEDAMKIHGLSKKDVDKMIKRINKAI